MYSGKAVLARTVPVIVIVRGGLRHPKKRSCLNRESQYRKILGGKAARKRIGNLSRWQVAWARAASPQLSAFLQRATDFAHRHVDAERGAVVAGVSLTGSSLLLGSVGFASQIPVFLFAPLGGIAADRINRHRMVIGTQIASMLLAFILAALTLLHRVQVWHVLVLAALLGVVNAFDIPGRQSFLVEMVGREDLMNAIALNSSMFNGARVIGPAIAGILVAKIGEGWCFFANGGELYRGDHRTADDEGAQPGSRPAGVRRSNT